MPDESDFDNTVSFPTRKITRSDVCALSAKLARERSEAPAAVDRILRETPRDAIPGLADHPELRCVGALDRLAATISTELARDPQYALALARLTVSLAEDLPVGAYPDLTRAQSRGLAWKELGKTLSFLGRHEEAVEAFEEAEADVETNGGLAHDLAIIWLNLSITYQEMGRYDEARRLLMQSKDLFRSFGDTRLFILSGLYEGHLLQRLRLYRQAREIYLLLLTSSTEIQKDHLAALHNAIGFCSIELQDYDDAEHHLSKTVSIHKKLHQPLDAAKADLGLGRLLIRRGFYDEGIAYLRPIRLRFLKHSLAEEAGLCGLDMVEGMLLAGQPESAETLARTITNEFLAAGLSSRAVTALGYLSDSIATRKASAKMAVEVREYVLSLRTTPEREFTLMLNG